jgi:APA family basic amino acid/polyamine antiporter
MSADGVFPRALGSLNARTGTPVLATGLTAGLASLLVLVGTFQQIVSFFICTAFGFIALAAAALFVVRRHGSARFRAPGYPLTPALFIVLLVAVILLVAVNRPLQAGSGVLIVLLGWPAYALFASRRSAAVSPGVSR